MQGRKRRHGAFNTWRKGLHGRQWRMWRRATLGRRHFAEDVERGGGGGHGLGRSKNGACAFAQATFGGPRCVDTCGAEKPFPLLRICVETRRISSWKLPRFYHASPSKQRPGIHFLFPTTSRVSPLLSGCHCHAVASMSRHAIRPFSSFNCHFPSAADPVELCVLQS